MPYSAMAKPPKVRTSDVPIDEPAPGLLPGEEAVHLDSGEDAAVIVEQRRMPNGSGMYFLARSRIIDADGATKLDEFGQPIMCEFGHTADMLQIDQMGVDAIAKELALVVLGEDPTTVRRSGNDEPEPVIPWPRSIRLEVSIRSASKLAGKSGKARNIKSLLNIK